MKSVKIEFIFLFITLFAGIIANTGMAKESEIRRDSHSLGYPYSYPYPYPYPNATAPKVNSITRGSANPTDLTSVNFTVIFSKDVMGVDIKDFGSCVREVHQSGKLSAWNFRSQTCLTMKIALSGFSSIFIPKD